MFKNREIRIRVAKTDNKIQEPAEPANQFPKDDIIDVATGVLKTAAICVASVIAAAAIVHVAEEIAIHHGTKK